MALLRHFLSFSGGKRDKRCKKCSFLGGGFGEKLYLCGMEEKRDMDKDSFYTWASIPSKKLKAEIEELKNVPTDRLEGAIDDIIDFCYQNFLHSGENPVGKFMWEHARSRVEGRWSDRRVKEYWIDRLLVRLGDGRLSFNEEKERSFCKWLITADPEKCALRMEKMIKRDKDGVVTLEDIDIRPVIDFLFSGVDSFITTYVRLYDFEYLPRIREQEQAGAKVEEEANKSVEQDRMEPFRKLVAEIDDEKKGRIIEAFKKMVEGHKENPKGVAQIVVALRKGDMLAENPTYNQMRNLFGVKFSKSGYHKGLKFPFSDDELSPYIKMFKRVRDEG